MPAGNLETQLSIVVTEMLIWSGSILPQVIQFNSIQFPNILVSIVPFNSRLNWIIESPGRFYPTGLWRMLLSPAEGCYLIGRIWTHTPTVISNFFAMFYGRFMSKRFQNFTADQSRPNLYTTKIRKPSHWSWLCRRPRNITTFIQLNSSKCCS